MVFIISGPAGSGKGTVVGEILSRDEGYICAVSATSRPMLKGEEEGVNYYYITREAFEEKIRTGGVLEYTEYCGNYYGTLVSEFDRAEQNGKHLILEIEVDGATQIKKKFPEAVLVMVTPPDATEQSRRLTTRGRDTEESIAKRLRRAAEELDYLPQYDYLIINETGGIQSAVDDFFALARAEQLKKACNIQFKENYFKGE